MSVILAAGSVNSSDREWAILEEEDE